MATNEVATFWANTRAETHAAKREAIAYRSRRYQRMIEDAQKAKITPLNSTGSWHLGGAMIVADQSNQPFRPMPGAIAQNLVSGGIRSNSNFASVRGLLNQRAAEGIAAAAAERGEPLPPSQIESLTPDDSAKIELNTLLQQIDDLIEVGDYRPVNTEVLRRAATMIARLAPDMTTADLQELMQFWENAVSVFEASLDARPAGPRSRAETGRFDFMDRILKYVTRMVTVPEDDRRARIAASRAFLRTVGITTSTVRRGVAENKERKADAAEIALEAAAAASSPSSPAPAVSEDAIRVATEALNVMFSAAPKTREKGAAGDDLNRLWRALHPRKPLPGKVRIRNDVLAFIKKTGRLPGGAIPPAPAAPAAAAAAAPAAASELSRAARAAAVAEAAPLIAAATDEQLNLLWRAMRPRKAIPSSSRIRQAVSAFVRQTGRLPGAPAGAAPAAAAAAAEAEDEGEDVD